MFAGGGNDAQIPELALSEEDFSDDGTCDVISLLVKAGFAGTRSEGRRAIEQGGVSLDGEKVTDVRAAIARDSVPEEGLLLKKGKKNYKKIVLA